MKFTKMNLLVGVFVIALSAIGLNYTNCVQQLSEQDSSSETNPATTSLTEKSDTKTTQEVKKDYGASTQGYADELNGRKFTLPLTGAVIHMEGLSVTPPKGIEYKDERGCLMDIASILDQIDTRFVLMQSKGETIAVGRQAGGSSNAGDYLLHGDASAPDQPVNCRYACPNGDRSCCVVSARGVFVDQEPTSQFMLSSDIVGKPIVSASGEKVTIKKAVHTDESGREFVNECYIDLNEIGNFKMNGGIKFDLILVRSSTSGGQTIYICKTPGKGCTITL